MVSQTRPEIITTEAITIRHAVREFGEWVEREGIEGVQPVVEDGVVWLTQLELARLLGCTKTNISAHIRRVYEAGDLREETASRRCRAQGGDGRVARSVRYTLDMATSLSYRICTRRSARFLMKTHEVMAGYAYGGADRGAAGRRNDETGAAPRPGELDALAARYISMPTREGTFTERVRALYATACDFVPGVGERPGVFSEVDAFARQEALSEVVGLYARYGAALAANGVAPARRDWQAVMGPLVRFPASVLAACTVRVVHTVARSILDHEYEVYQRVHGRVFSCELDALLVRLAAYDRGQEGGRETLARG